MTTVAVLQPGFLPWLGFFDQMLRSDVFVVYDDVQFDKHGWRNRNRIKTANGIAWLTVPVRHGGLHGQSIQDVKIDSSNHWARKLIATIRQAYAHAPHREPYAGQLAEVLAEPWESLLQLDLQIIELMARWLDVETQVVKASDLGIQGTQSGRLVEICRHFGADHYLSGNASKAYLDTQLFEKANIEIVWQDYVHPRYPQLHGEFVPYLSALDLILNVGPESPMILKGKL
jgi:WbqC-like protein